MDHENFDGEQEQTPLSESAEMASPPVYRRQSWDLRRPWSRSVACGVPVLHDRRFNRRETASSRRDLRLADMERERLPGSDKRRSLG